MMDEHSKENVRGGHQHKKQRQQTENGICSGLGSGQELKGWWGQVQGDEDDRETAV